MACQSTALFWLQVGIEMMVFPFHGAGFLPVTQLLRLSLLYSPQIAYGVATLALWFPPTILLVETPWTFLNWSVDQQEKT
eukprot:COSAG02_NODE_55_length_43887_cov_30.660364_8_plen_80_part_00